MSTSDEPRDVIRIRRRKPPVPCCGAAGGSWLNWIECEFALRYFARPNANFAVRSPIRTWTDYPAEAA
jgi:hypothetical protein